GTQCYYVVHLVKENTVEVVLEQWVENRDGVLCCYWPRNASATMVKRGERPDKILWEKYRISIFSSTDDDGSEALQKKTNEPRQAQLLVPQLLPAPSDQELPSLLDEPVASEMPAGYIKDLQAVEMRIMVKLEMSRTEFKTALNQVMEAIEARQPKESESLGQLEMLKNPAETNEKLKDICETLKDSIERKW
ncbi:unnamed protein product, partial [Coregonus sp. 'balchen']